MRIALCLCFALAVAAPSAWSPLTASASDSATTGTLPGIGECAAQAEGATDLLPDLRMAPLYGLVVRTSSTGRKRLRFGTISWNVGDGPIEARGDQRSGSQMGRVAQRIYDDAGGCRDVLEPDATMFFAGDGHNHWHVNSYIVTQLYKKGTANVLRIRKIGFCLLDLHRRDPALAHQPAERVYWNGPCGTSASQQIRMGISVGYADDYQPDIALQWIDVTGLPRDVYRLCSAVNPQGRWLERNMTLSNNYFWFDLRLNAARNSFTILDRGRTPCLKGVAAATATSVPPGAPAELAALGAGGAGHLVCVGSREELLPV